MAGRATPDPDVALEGTEDTRFICGRLSCPGRTDPSLFIWRCVTVTDSSMTDPEMSSVWKFVAEANLDEIFSGPATMDIANDVANTLVSFHSGGPVNANDTAVVIKTEPCAVSDTSSEVSYDDKTSVASFNSDETSEDEDIKPLLIDAATTAEIKRLKQKAYDKRYRDKKKVKFSVICYRVLGSTLTPCFVGLRLRRYCWPRISWPG